MITVCPALNLTLYAIKISPFDMVHLQYSSRWSEVQEQSTSGVASGFPRQTEQSINSLLTGTCDRVILRLPPLFR